MRTGARVVGGMALAALLAACGTVPPETRAERRLEDIVAEECTHAGLSTGQCAALLHACFHDVERCEIMGRPLRPPPRTK